MKIVGLFCLALSLVLAGCNLTNKSTKLPGDKTHRSEDVIQLNALILDLRKDTDTDWRDVLPGWEPKKAITVAHGNGQTLLAQIASHRNLTISIQGKTSSVTLNKSPVPFSLQEQSQAGKQTYTYTVDMVLTPAFITKTEPMTISVDMRIQDPQGDFSLSQVLSIPLRHSILAAHALNENTLQLVIITPELSTGENR